jgi:DNA-binding MarR family transcriptional regulator
MKKISSLADERFPVLLRGAWFGINKSFRTRLKPLGLTTTQFTVLRCIYENEGINQMELAQLISTNQNNSSSLIKRLYKLDFIKKKVEVEDRRSSLIQLTRKGKSCFQKAEKIAHGVHEEIARALPRDKEKDFIELLSTCTKNLSTDENE